MTEPITSTASTRKSRRALLAGALGGLGAVVASAAGRASPVRAGNDGDVVLGAGNQSASLTYIQNDETDAEVFKASTSGAGHALEGISGSGWGLYAHSDDNTAIYGTSWHHPALLATSWGSPAANIGLSGNFNYAGVVGMCGAEYLHQVPAKAKTGVFGYSAIDANSKGVWGQTTNGVGLYGQATGGYALQTAGRAKFSTSGLATITTGLTSKTVSPGVNVTSGSFVLLTPRANIGSRALWFTTNATANTFTIRMSSSRSSNTKVAWLLLG